MKLSASAQAYMMETDLAPTSRRWYRQKLYRFVEWASQQKIHDTEQLDWSLLSRYLDHVRNTPSEQYKRPVSTHTVHGHMRVIRAYLHWSVGEETVDARIFNKFRMPKTEEKVVKPFSLEQVERLIEVCKLGESERICERDGAVVKLLLDTGIRAEELCGLTVTNVRFSEDESYITVMGKGRKERTISMGKSSRKALFRWVHRFRPDTSQPYVFLSKQGGKLTVQGLDKILYRLRDRGEIEGVRCSAHNFRHTFAYNYVKAGGDVLRLSRILGHTNIVVTQEYIKAFGSLDATGRSVLDKMLG